jgi:hypothetical protein
MSCGSKEKPRRVSGVNLHRFLLRFFGKVARIVPGKMYITNHKIDFFVTKVIIDFTISFQRISEEFLESSAVRVSSDKGWEERDAADMWLEKKG